MANEKRLIDPDNAQVVAQRIYSDPVLIHAILNTLNSTPTVDAAPVVHGRWIDGYAVDSNGKKVYDSIDCSVCEEVYKIETHDREYWKGRFKQCFCCGAKMDL